MRRCFVVALEAAAFLALTISVNHMDRVTAAGDTAVDFLVTSDYAHANDTAQHFVARIIGDRVIAVARAELNKTDDFRIIAGEIVKSSVDWNPGWSYHLQPDSIHFGDYFIEVCDASATYVEENLADVGGAFLPGNAWCPWGTRVLEELQVISNYTYIAPPATTTSGSTTPVKTAGSILLLTLVGSFWSFGKIMLWRWH